MTGGRLEQLANGLGQVRVIVRATVDKGARPIGAGVGGARVDELGHDEEQQDDPAKARRRWRSRHLG